MALPLELELRTFNEKKEALLKSGSGKFVLIKGSRVIGTNSSEMELCRLGIRMFGNESFLVKKIEPVEQVQTYTRFIKLK